MDKRSIKREVNLVIKKKSDEYRLRILQRILIAAAFGGLVVLGSVYYWNLSEIKRIENDFSAIRQRVQAYESEIQNSSAILNEAALASELLKELSRAKRSGKDLISVYDEINSLDNYITIKGFSLNNTDGVVLNASASDSSALRNFHDLLRDKQYRDKKLSSVKIGSIIRGGSDYSFTLSFVPENNIKGK